MDNLFLIRVLTAAVNALPAVEMMVYNRIFRGREHLEITDRLAFDIISGSERLLKNIGIWAPATMTVKTGRRTVTLQAPRLASQRMIHAAELNALRAYGAQMAIESAKARIAREQQDMRNEIDRTIEFWACGALKGKIYDGDLTTVLVDYGLAANHDVTLSGTSLWTNAASNPINQLRAWKKLIADDAQTTITGWVAFCGSSVMDALLKHTAVIELLRYSQGQMIAENGRIAILSGVELIEYVGSFLDSTDTRQRFIGDDRILLVGLCQDLVDVPFAPVIDLDAPGGVGNVNAQGAGQLYFSKSWVENSPSGRWISVEARPLPVLMRPGAVVYAKAV